MKIKSMFKKKALTCSDSDLIAIAHSTTSIAMSFLSLEKENLETKKDRNQRSLSPKSSALMNQALRLFLFFSNLVQRSHQCVDIDAVNNSALFDVFKMSSSAAQAAHAKLHEYRSGARVFSNGIGNRHFFGDQHMKSSLS